MQQQQMDGDKMGDGTDINFAASEGQQQMSYGQQFSPSQMQPPSDWQELDDVYNMINEDHIEPDYYIDRPVSSYSNLPCVLSCYLPEIFVLQPDAVFIPDEDGVDKAIQLNNVDPDLFDFNLEVEPILQVLVGKSLEQARIEVIEDYESEKLVRHKADYKQRREAMLIQTQRIEAR